MMGKTHLVLGIAAALVVTQPQTPTQFAIAVAGGALGGVAPDIDVKLIFKNQFAAKEAWDALGSEIAALLIAIGISVTDYLMHGDIFERILERKFLAIPGMILFIGLVIFGEVNKKHREKTHSLVALALSSAGMYMLHPDIGIAYAISFASHIISDMFNKKKIRLLYPFDKKGICFELCYSDRLVNQLLSGISLTIIFIYVYMVLSKGSSVLI